MSRWIEVEGVVNMRDLGGLPTSDGCRTQPRRLIRSDNLQDLSEDAVRHLIDEVGVSDVVDLRTHRELHLTGDGPLRSTPLRHHHHSFLPDPPPGQRGLVSDDPVRVPRADANYWSQHYRGYLTQRPDSVAAALSVVATASGATIVHCAAGKDRTGTVVGLALAVAGVPRAEIVADYVLTSERLDRIMARLNNIEPYRSTLQGSTREAQIPQARSMDLLLDLVDEQYGGAAGWLLAHGWTDADVEQLRAKLVNT